MQGKHKLIHERVLEAVHREAWKEGAPQPQAGDQSIVGSLRCEIGRGTWDGIKSIPARKRKREGFTRRNPGVQRLWEDCFVMHYGSNWRETRDSCQSAREWKLKSKTFVLEICKEWRLPSTDPSIAKPSGLAMKSQRLGPAAAGPPAAEGNLAITWAEGTQRFQVLVDNLSVQK